MNFAELADKIGLDESDYRELIELFLETGMADYDQLQSACAAGDAQQVARSAHTISGASGNLGLMNIHEVAKRIELVAIEGRLNGVDADASTLEGLFDEIAKVVRS